MHNVRIEGSYAKGVKYLREADQLMFRLREMVKAGGIESGGLHANFSPDVYAYARVGPGIAVVSIVADPDPEASETREPLPQFESTASPDFLCGIVYQGFITRVVDDEREYETLSDFRPDQRTGRLFRLGEDRQTNKRLAVKPYSTLSEDLSGDGSRAFSQYTVLRPGFYSGTMAKLVQTLMGYGKFPEKSIYGEVVRQVNATDSFYFETQFQNDIIRNGNQIRYDWRFHRTHGLTRASDGKWWVVEIRAGRGIHAMPLALYETTTTTKFRERAEDLGDDAALAVLDLFGGFPTGESLPGTDVELEAMIRAGYVVQGANASVVAPFYQNIPYSRWLGWAFSESGSKADNTAWRVDPDKFQTGFHYRCELSIGDVDTEIALSLQPSAGASTSLKRHVMSANVAGPGRIPPPDFKLKIRAVLLKVDRLTASQTQLFLGMLPVQAFNDIDALVLAPIAQFSASMMMVSSSRICQPSKYGPQFKYYDPDIGGIVSHDGRQEFGADLAARPNTDATVHVFYVGEALHFAKLYYRVRPARIQTETNGELFCGLVGRQVTTSILEVDDNANGAYTETYDDRATSYSAVLETTTTGTRIGPVSISFGDDPTRPFISFMQRSWAFRIETEVRSSTSGIVNMASVSVPEGMREAYFYAVRRSFQGSVTNTSVGYQTRGDAYSYTGWRNLPGFTGSLPMGCVGTPAFPACWSLEEHPAGCGPVRDRHVWEQVGPAEDECSALTNSGPWASTCDQMETMAYSTPLPQVAPVTTSIPPYSELTVFFVSGSQMSPVATMRRTVSGPDYVFNGDPWFLLAPSETGGPQSLVAQVNEMGSGSTAKFSETLNGEVRVAGLPAFDDMRSDSFTFVGVIDG